MANLNVRSISAVTLTVADMARSVDFYREKVGLELLYGGGSASFTSFKIGDSYLNLTLAPPGALEPQGDQTSRGSQARWGRLIFHVDDVDALYRSLVEAGLTPTTEPADASWGERYFHIDDPDSHDLSFAKPL